MGQNAITRWPESERRRNLARVINECDGVLINVAHRLGTHRATIYVYCKRYKLWPVVNACRKVRLQRELEERQKKYRGGTWA